MQFSAATQIDDLRAEYARIDTWLELDADALRQRHPGISGWTAEQQLAHVALANELTFRNVRSLVRRQGVLIVQGGETTELARAILVPGRIPRGESQAPRMVRPPQPVRRELLIEWLSDNRADLERIAERALEIDAAPGRIPHALIGTLSALEWLRFGNVHTRHHTTIAAELLDATA